MIRLLCFSTLLFVLGSCTTKFEHSEVMDSSSVTMRPETAMVPADSTTHEPQKKDSTPAALNIKLLSPREGAMVSPDGFEVKGLARTFENAVSYRLKLESGKLIEGHTTATGEMGTFSPFNITLSPKETGRATLEVFENSAKDGSEINKVIVHVLVGNEH